MKKYDHIFFDLDRTLWDFDTNSFNAMKELFEEFRLEEIGIKDFTRFHSQYKAFNDAFWMDYRDGKVGKEVLRWVRFYKTFELYGIQDKRLSERFSDAYLEAAPRKEALIDGVQEVLEALYPKYPLHIITNGFSETQGTKLSSSRIAHYFRVIINSDSAGCQKPARKIFEHALKSVDCADPSRCLMIGDDYIADVEGAIKAGWDAIWFNPHKLEGTANLQIQHMHELLRTL